jgi:AraC-like DNA-binding protein
MHQDSPLGRWRVDLCPPRAELRAHVDMLWYGEGRVAYQRDRILPTGGAYLLINLGPRQYRIEAGPPERRVAFDDVWYSGPHTGPIDTEAPHGNALLGVALRACGSHAWSGVRADALAQATLPLADVVGPTATRLRERLLHCTDSLARFELVEDWLLQHLHPRRTTHAVVEWALGRIANSGGRIEVEALARESGFSRKHLATLFRDQVGLGPKALARLHRFRAALQLIERAERVPWTQLAAHCGYFDQAHLIRDFHAFCGFSPGEFLRHQRADATSIVLR